MKYRFIIENDKVELTFSGYTNEELEAITSAFDTKRGGQTKWNELGNVKRTTLVFDDEDAYNTFKNKLDEKNLFRALPLNYNDIKSLVDKDLKVIEDKKQFVEESAKMEESCTNELMKILRSNPLDTTELLIACKQMQNNIPKKQIEISQNDVLFKIIPNVLLMKINKQHEKMIHDTLNNTFYLGFPVLSQFSHYDDTKGFILDKELKKINVFLDLIDNPKNMEPLIAGFKAELNYYCSDNDISNTSPKEKIVREACGQLERLPKPKLTSSIYNILKTLDTKNEALEQKKNFFLKIFSKVYHNLTGKPNRLKQSIEKLKNTESTDKFIFNDLVFLKNSAYLNPLETLKDELKKNKTIYNHYKLSLVISQIETILAKRSESGDIFKNLHPLNVIHDIEKNFPENNKIITAVDNFKKSMISAKKEYEKDTSSTNNAYYATQYGQDIH